jgi:hypothetical protein
MSFQVYRIETFDNKGNSHAICREENWIVKKDQSFDTLEDALEYIRNKTKMVTHLPTLLIDVKSQEEKRKIIDDFCFHDPVYTSYRRYFLNKPCLREIKAALQKHGIQVKNDA